MAGLQAVNGDAEGKTIPEDLEILGATLQHWIWSIIGFLEGFLNPVVADQDRGRLEEISRDKRR